MNYKPEKATTKANTAIVFAFCALFGAAAWHSLTTTLDQQQKYHCEQGWQPACEKLK